MRIGLDLDDTICSTDIVIRKYVDNYCQKNKILVNELWSNKELKNDFLTNNLEKIYSEAKIKQGVKTTLNKLKQDGHKLYIVTARTNKYVKTDMKSIINNYLNSNNIFVDDIFIDGKDKVDICKNNKIDIMLEDNLYNYNLLNDNGINVVLFDEKNIHKEIDNRIVNWTSLINFIKNI